LKRPPPTAVDQKKSTAYRSVAPEIIKLNVIIWIFRNANGNSSGSLFAEKP
jgi:hypothetical protein